ncbi:MAG: hypothetical protein SNJ82_09495 [Gemmataceae bacterium]
MNQSLHAKPMIEGPLGFPMPEASARAVEALLRRLPRSDHYHYRHLMQSRAMSECNPGERSDVSWISTEAVDRAGEIVRANGMDDSEFRLNPLVTLEHNYTRPPVGRCLWRRRVRDGQTHGIKAKTYYPPRPTGLEPAASWPPDEVFAHIQAGLLTGKSIGFLPLQTHIPDEAEVRANGWPENVRLVIDRWLLLEYACVSLPANPLALVQSVSKQGTPFTRLATVASRIERQLQRLDLRRFIESSVQLAVDRARGRV